MSTDAPRMVPLIAGQTCIGFLLSAGPRGVSAYDRDENFLGVFTSAIEAAATVERSAVANEGGAR
jgi:hypothetical protein